jgi:hypothetical protein
MSGDGGRGGFHPGGVDSILGKEVMEGATVILAMVVATVSLPMVVATVTMLMVVVAVNTVVAAVTLALAEDVGTMAIAVVDMAPAAVVIEKIGLPLFHELGTIRVLATAMRVTEVDVGIKVMVLVVLEAIVILYKGNLVARLEKISMGLGIMLMMPFREAATLLITTVDSVVISKGGIQVVVVPL